MNNFLLHCVDQLTILSALVVGVWLGMRKEKSKFPEEERKFRKWYHQCQYCKHCNIRGQDPARGREIAAFCFHPDCCSNFQSIDRVQLNFYCGKWEASDSFNTELFKAHSERCLESPIQGLKKL